MSPGSEIATRPSEADAVGFVERREEFGEWHAERAGESIEEIQRRRLAPALLARIAA